MKRLSTLSLCLVSVLILTLLSGCIISTSSIQFNYSGAERLSESQDLFVRYSDKSVYQVPKLYESYTSASTDSSKTVVGGYVSDGVVSWVPNYSYNNYSGSVNVSGYDTTRPTSEVSSIQLAESPQVSTNHPEYVNVTFAVYNASGQLLDGKPEIFIHSTDSNVIFYNFDSQETPPFSADSVNEGFSSYAVNGYVTFLVKTNLNDIFTKPISLYSGPTLITGNPFQVVTGIEVGSVGNASTLKVGESLQMNAGIVPQDALNQALTWSVENGTGEATIDENGELTAVSPGTVTVKASATDGSAVFGTKELMITLPVDSISVTTPNEVYNILEASSVIMSAVVAPGDATNREVRWSVVNGTGSATINETTGELTAGNPGTITVKATAVDGSGVIGSVELTVTALPVPVTAITLTGSTSVQVGASVQFTKTIAPDNATNKSVTWSVVNGTGQATINASGELAAVSAGTVTVTATAADGTAVVGSKEVTITEVSTGGGDGGTPTPITPTTSQPTQTPVIKPEPTPTAKPEVKFDEQVIKVEKVVANLNKKIEEAKVNPNAGDFKDTTSHWADATVNVFVKLGVVNGYKDGNFHPNSNITRAEFATIISKVFDLSTTSAGNTLTDTSGHWAESSINALMNNGMISGYADGTFKPNKEISRAEIISIIAKLITLQNATMSETPAFSDIGGAWNKDQIEQAAAAGIITGDGVGQFRPNKQASRAEALTMVLHVLQMNPELNTLLETIK